MIRCSLAVSGVLKRHLESTDLLLLRSCFWDRHCENLAISQFTLPGTKNGSSNLLVIDLPLFSFSPTPSAYEHTISSHLLPLTLQQQMSLLSFTVAAKHQHQLQPKP